jgi:hypothetical protein
MNETGEYKIRPYKGFLGERRGEPCVHPAFSDSLNLPAPVSFFILTPAAFGAGKSPVFQEFFRRRGCLLISYIYGI